MKKVLSLASMAVLMASFTFAQDIKLAAHDILYSGTQQGCKSCHTPHGGARVDTVTPDLNTVFGTSTTSDPTTGKNKLWDKLLATGTFATYTSENVAGTPLTKPTTTSDPAWHSFLCLSCHDGIAAGLNLTTGMVGDDHLLTNAAAGGDVDLANDHPVDLAWPTDAWGVAQYETVANVTSLAGVTGFSTKPLPLFGTNNKIECATCHNPHDNTASLSGAFLRVDNTGNVSLCRTCHLGKR